MKKLTALILTLVILVTAMAAAPFGVSAAAAFQAGDVLYLKIENPYNWATVEGTSLYVNFTDATRAENGNKSIVIAEADKSRYNPVTGVTYDAEKGLYRYTVTQADAGKTVMRFWRGNAEKLWNESVAITAEDLMTGTNTAVVTDWTNTGYLTSTHEYELTVALSLSATKGEVGDIIDIAVTHNEIAGADFTYAIRVNDALVSDSASFTFIPQSDGIYKISALVYAVKNGKTVAVEEKSASVTIGSAPITALEPNCLYAHAASGVSDKEAWVKGYWINNQIIFFMPSSAKAFDTLELYNTYSGSVIIDGTEIPANSGTVFSAQTGNTLRASIEPLDLSVSVQFYFSSAEAALWVNNTDSFGDSRNFFEYLKADKSNSIAATGAVSTPDGKIENTPVKKMKGRGNTSWYADKKGFNVTLESAIKLAGMEKCKKFSLISNFQDAAMARNRILYDLSNAVGVPYASDSRFIDLYTNGEYQGTYQMCRKIDVSKNGLITGFAEDDYLNTETGGVKDDFSFVTEIDSSPAEEDFHFTVNNGNNLTMKAPELEAGDPNRSAVESYIKNKYNAMFSSLASENINDYIDVPSLAKVYLINELGKNWDSGASSFYLTYQQDKNGVYKFFASPVWDYDNSLGNARGVGSDLRNLGISDYTLPSGWFSSKKNGYNGPNILAQAVKNPVVMAEVRRTWFEDFLPALDILNSDSSGMGELQSASYYADVLRDTAAMNYKIWELVTNGSWIADHSSLRQIRAAYTKNSYGQVTEVNLTQDSSATLYDQYSFDGQFDYMMDWTNSRAAWISAQYISGYTPVAPTEPPTQAAPTEAPTLPPEDVIEPDLTDVIAAWVFDAQGKTSGDKLTEYGSADNGYAATTGSGLMTLSVSGTKSRALEWSSAEYGKSGSLTVPVMAAGSKNQWGSPYIDLTIPAIGCDELKLTMYLGASSKAPASWKLQYSINGTDYTDIGGKVFTITSDSRKTLTAYFSKSDLPDFAYSNKSAGLSLRLVPTDMKTVDGSNALDAPAEGELAINDVVVQGRKLGYDDVLMGDVDGSGNINIIDATYLQRYLVTIYNLSSKQIVASDVTRDGSPNIIDVTALQRALAGISSPYLILK